MFFDPQSGLRNASFVLEPVPYEDEEPQIDIVLEENQDYESPPSSLALLMQHGAVTMDEATPPQANDSDDKAPPPPAAATDGIDDDEATSLHDFDDDDEAMSKQRRVHFAETDELIPDDDSDDSHDQSATDWSSSESEDDDERPPPAEESAPVSDITIRLRRLCYHMSSMRRLKQMCEEETDFFDADDLKRIKGEMTRAQKEMDAMLKEEVEAHATATRDYLHHIVDQRGHLLQQAFELGIDTRSSIYTYFVEKQRTLVEKFQHL